MPADMLRSAISQLRLKLLDLTGRNRLINFKHNPGKSLQFVGGSIADVVGKLLDEGERSAIPVLPLPEPPVSAYVRRAGRLEPPDPAEWARRQKISTSYEIEDIEEDEEDDDEDEGRRTPPPVVLQTLLFGEPLARHCRKLEREAVLAIEETGANMLFLVAGMLEFPDQKDSERSFSAPLICIPVVFKSVARANYQSFSIQSTGEEITENLSLREKLRNDYDITLPEFNDEDLDIASYFAAIEAVIGEKPGFELHHTLSLCLLSFSSMLMVRDLDPDKWPVAQNGNGLIDHPVVKTIFEGSPDSAAGDGYSFAEEYAVEEGEGAAIPLVYDADSSQHSALIDVLAKKRNLVIEGPPGTGKSQTITNLIAASIASGKTVLFVAEKLAALQVVQSRLDAAGLGPFILELHSSKSNKKQVIESLGQRLDLRPRGVPPEWKARQEQLEGHRRALREYADAINSVAHNAMGLTLHQVMWRAERHRASLSTMHPYLSTLSILGTSTLSTFEFSQRTTCLKAIADQYELVGGFNTHSPFWGFYPKNLVQGDEVAIRELLRDASAGAKALEEITRRLVDDLSIPVNSWPDQIDKQAVALKEFKEGLDRSLPLTVISRFFKAKEAGQDPRKILTDFRDSVDRYNRRIVSIERVLKTMEPDQVLVERLTDLTEFAGRLSVPLGTVDGVADFERQLSKLHEDLKAGLQALERIAKGLSIDVAPRQSVIRPVLALAAIVEEPVDDCLRLWTPGLARPGVLDDLRDMEALQRERFELERQLGCLLYTSPSPRDGLLSRMPSSA